LRRKEPDMADPWLEHLTVDYDEDERWITVHRGGLRIACNLGAEPVTVPVTGEVVLAWGEPKVDADSAVLEGHSFAILATHPQM
jgi:maltooligosyltrehalose trehalohydrolase